MRIISFKNKANKTKQRQQHKHTKLTTDKHKHIKHTIYNNIYINNKQAQNKQQHTLSHTKQIKRRKAKRGKHTHIR